MTEKRPEAGEWWEAILIGGVDPVIVFSVPNELGMIAVDSAGFTFGAHDFDTVAWIRHLPDCTGFDYETPPASVWDGAGWYRTECGKCFELNSVRQSRERASWDRIPHIDYWNADGSFTDSVCVIVPALRLVEKIDAPTELSDDKYEHLDPPELRVPVNGEYFLPLHGHAIKRGNGRSPSSFNEGRRWIVCESKLITKLITMTSWVCRDCYGYWTSPYATVKPALAIAEYGSYEVEVPL